MMAYSKDSMFKLAEITGYDVQFLENLWEEECTEGECDFDYFWSVSIEKDW